jgi:hypothetical protein
MFTTALNHDASRQHGVAANEPDRVPQNRAGQSHGESHGPRTAPTKMLATQRQARLSRPPIIDREKTRMRNALALASRLIGLRRLTPIVHSGTQSPVVRRASPARRCEPARHAAIEQTPTLTPASARRPSARPHQATGRAPQEAAQARTGIHRQSPAVHDAAIPLHPANCTVAAGRRARPSWPVLSVSGSLERRDAGPRDFPCFVQAAVSEWVSCSRNRYDGGSSG